MTEQLVSTIIPVYNAAHGLIRCLNSASTQFHAQTTPRDVGNCRNSQQQLALYQYRSLYCGVQGLFGKIMLYPVSRFIPFADLKTNLDLRKLNLLITSHGSHKALYNSCTYRD